MSKTLLNRLFVVVAAVSLLVMISWWMKWKPLLGLLPGAPTMKFNTALLFFFSAIAAILDCKAGKYSNYRFFFTVPVIIFSAFTFYQDLFGVDLGIDELFARDPYSSMKNGRMSIGTSISFFLIGIVYSTINIEIRIIKYIRKLFKYAVLFFAIISFVAYLLNLSVTERLDFIDTMAVHTSLFFIILSLLAILKHPTSTEHIAVLGTEVGSQLFRRQLAFIFSVPLVFGMVILWMVHHDYFSMTFGYVLLVVLVIPVNLVYAYIMALKFNEKDRVKNQIRKDLIKRNQELERYTFIASHDLQEPMRTISNYIGLLKRFIPEDIHPHGKKSIETIEIATSRMQKLILDLLHYSRLGKNSNLTKVDLNNTLSNVKNDLKSLIIEKNTRIKSDELPTIPGFESELYQLFQNLISNGIKYHKPGIPPEIEIIYCELDEYYQISFIDNGIGIKKQGHEIIFDLFRRLHNRREYDGSGIGLSSCLKIARMHLGEIALESEENKGSTFIVTLSKNLDEKEAEKHLAD